MLYAAQIEVKKAFRNKVLWQKTAKPMKAAMQESLARIKKFAREEKLATEAKLAIAKEACDTERRLKAAEK